MNLVKCGLCGFEFERGNKICRGCHGNIRYGAGALKWIFGTLYAGVTWYALIQINENWFKIDDTIGLSIIASAFIFGAIHATYIFRHKVSTVKFIEK